MMLMDLLSLWVTAVFNQYFQDLQANANYLSCQRYFPQVTQKPGSLNVLVTKHLILNNIFSNSCTWYQQGLPQGSSPTLHLGLSLHTVTLQGHRLSPRPTYRDISEIKLPFPYNKRYRSRGKAKTWKQRFKHVKGLCKVTSSCYQQKQNQLSSVGNRSSWDALAYKIHEIASGLLHLPLDAGSM
ncbi:hypothetical protein Anapl_12404 [Anas platyrhynchos]|uniref:Uncharacterized protein n=1 Tax=Anas platyrhynchos TaxID=8839 RepID=R0JZW3_ANAPL|nr:hypothetical protein Anapl_12404 [Anas platyrhynchos]